MSGEASGIDDVIGLFIDRWKCFDLIVPELVLQVAEGLGFPSPVAKAAKGFSSEPSKSHLRRQFLWKQGFVY